MVWTVWEGQSRDVCEGLRLMPWGGPRSYCPHPTLISPLVLPPQWICLGNLALPEPG